MVAVYNESTTKTKLVVFFMLRNSDILRSSATKKLLFLKIVRATLVLSLFLVAPSIYVHSRKGQTV